MKFKVYLDTAYFAENKKLITENNKKIIFELLFTPPNTVHWL